jgi:hypothetical protein
MGRFARSVAIASVLLSAGATGAFAQAVFSGDPTDGGGTPYTIMPDLPLVLAGNDEEVGTDDDTINTGFTGDVDLVIRATVVTGPAIPAPAGATGGPSVPTVTAGGGSSGQGAELDFTIAVSDGSGSPPYGNLLSGSDLDARPAVVYAFADLDGDGTLGPTNADGSGDNAIELQEASAYSGRQVGSLIAGRVTGSLGFHIAAPESLGGLRHVLVAGAYAGQDPEELFAEGPMLLTAWPFFPPLDPARVIGNGNVPPPDPEVPSELKFELDHRWLPAPGHPQVGSAFALPLDGSSPTVDLVDVASGPVAGIGAFVDFAPDATNVATRLAWRVAPEEGGGSRTIVLPVSAVTTEAGGLALRILPIDRFGNVADPSAPFDVELSTGGNTEITSPDGNASPASETVTVDDAGGVTVTVNCSAAPCGSLDLVTGGLLHKRIAIAAGSAADSDGDGIADDGDGSGIVGDHPCSNATAGCDDNCVGIDNPSQVDNDLNGIGDCCDGICAEDPTELGCSECPDGAVTPTADGITRGTLIVKTTGSGEQRLIAKLRMDLDPGASIDASSESVTLAIAFAGGGSYSAELVAAFEDRSTSKDRFTYQDNTASVDGVYKGLISERRAPEYKALFKARGVGLAEASSGSALVTLTIGDDVVAGPLTCTGSPTKLRCSGP